MYKWLIPHGNKNQKGTKQTDGNTGNSTKTTPGKFTRNKNVNKESQ
ncbi:hypothetical protein ADIARSV_0580 [Arcticibacter svalbardensis MN12-7]|uniref:Uncharacterized protein n=1 Tax=Arcticibacter svalbardensis MN12-7 TaxID=1150600 RepID=R9H508_9SPHI|nr:hypothetical protein ADIARSV_0580 [Arcticibacter svalbardensis MN12-7]